MKCGRAGKYYLSIANIILRVNEKSEKNLDANNAWTQTKRNRIVKIVEGNPWRKVRGPLHVSIHGVSIHGTLLARLSRISLIASTLLVQTWIKRTQTQIFFHSSIRYRIYTLSLTYTSKSDFPGVVHRVHPSAINRINSERYPSTADRQKNTRQPSGRIKRDSGKCNFKDQRWWAGRRYLSR